MKHRRSLMPASLAVLGVLLLIGCIPVPSTQQFMVNNHLKPSWRIGNSSGKPIWLGHTSIDDARKYLNTYLSGTWVPKAIPWGSDNPMRSVEDVDSDWQKVDKNHYAILYRVRTTFLFMPLCAAMLPLSNDQCLILKTNDTNQVVGYEILSVDAFKDRYPLFKLNSYDR